MALGIELGAWGVEKIQTFELHIFLSLRAFESGKCEMSHISMTN